MRKFKFIFGLLLAILTQFFISVSPTLALTEPINTWSLDSSLTQQSANHKTLSFNNYLVNFGGSTLDDFSIVQKLDTSLIAPFRNWVNESISLPQNIYWHSIANKANKVYLLGGTQYPPQTSKDFVFRGEINNDGDILSWSPTTSLPQRLSKGAAAIIGDYIYFSGGWTDQESAATASKKVYFALINADGSLGNWNTTTDLPDVLWDHGMVTFGKNLYIVGGWNSSGITNQVWRATANDDGTLGTWTAMPNLPGKVRSGGITIVDNYVFVVGGYSGNFLNSVYFTTIDSVGQMAIWQTSANNLPVRNCCGSLAAVGNYLYLIGGYISGSGYTDLVFKTKLNITTSKPTVIFLPGLGGSWNYEAMIHGQDVANSQWKIPGFIKNYDALISALSNTDLKIYAYDWRKPISTNADSLYDYAKTLGTKVNLIGHSMGGLIAQKMTDNHPELVDKIITLGSPYSGALSTYKIWEGADFSDFPITLSLAAKLYLRINRNNFDTDVTTIQNNIPSLADVLPTFDYLKNASGKPSNTFLPISNVSNLSKIQGGGYDTPKYYTVKPASVFETLLKKWRYGKPAITEYASGDNTVLQTENETVASTHAEIANNIQTQNKILEIIGVTGTTSTSVLPAYQKAILVTVASPVNFELVTPSSTVYPQDGLIVLDNPENGNYSVKITPVNTGGNYTIYFGRINGNNISWDEVAGSISSGTNTHNFSLVGNPIQTSQTKSLEIINIIKNYGINTVSKNLLLQDASRIHSGIADLAKQTKQSIYDAKIVSLFKQIDVLTTKIKNLKLNTDTIVAKYRLIKADLEIDRGIRFGN